MLQIEDLAIGYQAPVARLTSLSLAEGEVALLLGPSGQGKTTLLLGIAGLARRFAGRALIDGTDPHALSGSACDRFRGRQIGFVFQDLHLVAGLSVLDNVLLSPYATGAKQDRARAHVLLAKLGLEPHASRNAERLSRGQAQRVAIARAMQLRPKLLLIDEPTASLDDASCVAVSDLLADAAAETGAALLIATHDTRLKARFSRHVTVEAP